MCRFFILKINAIITQYYTNTGAGKQYLNSNLKHETKKVKRNFRKFIDYLAR